MTSKGTTGTHYEKRAPLKVTRSKGEPGRPTTYTEPLAKEFCIRISEGRSINDITTNDADMPNRYTITTWLRDNLTFQDMYWGAMASYVDVKAEEILELADSDGPESAKTAADPTAVRHRQLQIESRKWLAQVLNRRRYGNKVDVDQNIKTEIKQITRNVVDPKKIEYPQPT